MLARILKRLLCLIFLTCSVTPARAAFQGPLETPAAPSKLAAASRLTAVTQSGSRLVAVGPRGVVLLSEGIGKKWKQVAVPVSSNLVALHFPTLEQGWAVGHEGVVLHTADAGRSWTKQLDGNQAGKAILAHYEKLAAAGDAAAAKAIPDATRLAQEGADKPFLDVWFANEKEGFAVGAFNLIMRTTDGGKSWTPLIDRTDNPKALHLYAIRGSGQELYLAGEMGFLRRWDRASERFVALTSPYQGSFFGLLVKEGTLIAFGMRGNAFQSHDGGKSWRKLETGTTAGLTGGALLADGRVVLVSQDGKVLVLDAGSEKFLAQKVEKPMAFSSVAPAGKDGIVAVGARGVMTESLR